MQNDEARTPTPDEICTIADLEALLAKATPGKWHTPPYLISMIGPSNAALIAATHNALPAILRVIRAAEAYIRASDKSPYGEIVDQRFEALRLALAALGEGPREGSK